MSPGVVKLVREAGEDRGNRLHGAEFDATTWSTRTWTSFTMQRISCALMVAVAWELAGAMGLASVGDTRRRRRVSGARGCRDRPLRDV